MTQVVIKGESVYKCDVCKRKIRVPTNKQGFDVLQRCNITKNCQGKLHRVTQQKEVNDTPTFPPEVAGVQDWFQRKVLFTFEQTIQSITWIIKHNLENKPVLHVFVNRIVDGVKTLVPIEPTTITTVDLNTTIITFDVAETGTAQCVALASQNTTNPNTLVPAQVSQSNVQLTTNAGELTIATLDTTPIIGLVITYYTPSQTLNVEYIGISNVPSVNSPWVEVPHIMLNGKKYTVRSLNLVSTPLAPSYFSTGLIVNGVSFYINSINGTVPAPGDGIILLSQEPYAFVDRIYDKYIDVAFVNTTAPEFFYDTGKGFTTPNIIKQTYPPIIVITQ